MAAENDFAAKKPVKPSVSMTKTTLNLHLKPTELKANEKGAIIVFSPSAKLSFRNHVWAPTTNFAHCYFAAPVEIKKEPEQPRRRIGFMLEFSPGETATWKLN